MNDQDCSSIREWIPDVVAGRADANTAAVVARHVTKCAECAAEHELVTLLVAGAIEVPAGLAERVQGALRPGRGVAGRPWWGVAAAAVAAVALGIGVSPTQTVVTDVPGYAAESTSADMWMSGDGVIAGAPFLDGLSVEELGQLLDELVSESNGGAA